MVAGARGISEQVGKDKKRHHELGVTTLKNHQSEFEGTNMNAKGMFLF